MAKMKGSTPQAGKPPPRCKAILLCERTIVEAVTSNVSLIGIFSRFKLRQIPGYTRPVTAFLQLVEGIGRYEIEVEIHDLRQDKVIARAAGPGIVFPERLSRLNLIIAVPPLPIPHAGVYDVVVFADGQEIDRQQFRTVSAEERGEHGDEETQTGS